MKIDQLTFTRFLAASWIVMFHFIPLVWPVTNPYLDSIFKNGNVAVSFFFVLSGFVMMAAYSKYEYIDFWEFLRKRFIRIYPAYLLALVILFVLFIWKNEILNTESILLNVFFIQAWFPEYVLTFNYPAWSVSVEFFFYILFPFLYNYVYKKYSLKTIAAGVILFWIASQIVSNELRESIYYTSPKCLMHKFIYFSPIMHLNSFLVGNLIGYIYMLHSEKRKNYDGLLMLLFIIILFGLICDFGLVVQNGLFAIVFAPLIYFMAKNNGRISQIFSKKPLRLLGEISYGIYILQIPVFLFTVMLAQKIPDVSQSDIFITGSVLLILLSGLSYWLIENPIRNKMRTFVFSSIFK